MATWDDVRRTALLLPDAEESTSYGKLAFKVRRRGFAWESPHEPGALAIYVDQDERPFLLESHDVYWITPHYEGHPIMLVHLDGVGEDELRELIVDSWLLRAPSKLAAAYQTARP